MQVRRAARAARTLVASLAIAAVGCGNDDGGPVLDSPRALDADGGTSRPSDGGDGSDASMPADAGSPCGVEPRLGSIHQRVFTTVLCSANRTCHGNDPTGSELQLNLDKSAVRTNLLAATFCGMACGDGNMVRMRFPNRVVPGDPDRSFLWHKISSPTPIGGDPMPLGQPPLNACQLDAIRTWIVNGALDD